MPAKHETWMPLYIADYLGDTLHLTTEQHGAYLLLIMAAWKRGGHLPDDEAQLAQIARMPLERWQSHAAATVLPFFTHRDGMLWHGRVAVELDAARSKVEQKSAAGAAGAAARWRKDGSRNASAIAGAKRPEWRTDAQSPSPSEEETPPSPRKRGRASADRFDDFWLAWPKSERKQDKAKCIDHWTRNSLDETADLIIADVRTKRGTTKWQEGYIEAPLVYLRGKRWQDGVEPDGGKPGAAVADWRDTSTGIRAKGIELGIGDWDEEAFQHGRGEHFPAYRARVERAAAEQRDGQADPAGLAKIASIVGAGFTRKTA